MSSSDFGFGPTYADIVLAVGTITATTSCFGTGGVPACTMPEMPQTGACASNPALGMPDGVTYDLAPFGRIELGFLCSAIVARPLGLNDAGMLGLQPDFIIYGSVDPGATPAVQVSTDGSAYVSVNPWAESDGAFVTNPAFQLQAALLTSARFVRISNTSGTGVVHIDALEALMGLIE